MTQASSRADGSVGAKGPDELRRQIEETRAQLGDTVEELAAKADVKARVHAAQADVKAKAQSAWERVPREMLIVGGASVAVAAVGVLVWRHYR
ncbi:MULTISPECIES: DUF3618 domain-containing protein [Streptomyces]|uniref:DUF3618 domain-containing protein n=1 Tax=Streptomyces stelliscabiei TaxID=146820 RepID=A0A8I0P0Y5_9ACTN|nr:MULTISPECIES: DUF3618 domain-containing protein [Streptomyces]KND44811.1 hypothetical protein IQ64_10355 [Streptomyces stelliscabiei]MBE1596185.1 hypothetical protein [Streptomyces stelliscabiei]MDX2519675.1 DUF3618 domain-containing protein [Streptomyces stelliscabiei]MDX2556710.1 DUF3618 domain-containing protein [Streptomyces stelliscabiei]MDX2615713.1 DUF3618 domain-containing protein [Streptomyces stelliscabiei]